MYDIYADCVLQNVNLAAFYALGRHSRQEAWILTNS
jgi:hypothetical protein